MRTSLVLASFLGGAIALPSQLVKRNNPANGFPSPSQSQLMSIEQAALGTVPNSPLPAKISSDGLTNFQLINLNENFEVYYFTSLLNNVTNNVPGYTFQDQNERAYIIKALTAVIAQEELHALAAATVLKAQGKDAIQPCQYMFPVSNFNDAITLAYTFTEVVLGTLADIILHFAQDGDTALTALIASVVGQEGEQTGYYRSVLGKVPSSLPFLTGGIRDYAFTALQSYSIPGSCPNINEIQLTTFAPLTLYNKNIQPQDQQLQFAFDTSTLSKATVPNAGSYANFDFAGQGALVYINQQNVPVVVSIDNYDKQGTYVKFTANFPYSANELNGLSIAVVTNSKGPFASAQAVANATVFGPAPIEIN